MLDSHKSEGCLRIISFQAILAFTREVGLSAEAFFFFLKKVTAAMKDLQLPYLPQNLNDGLRSPRKFAHGVQNMKL